MAKIFNPNTEPIELENLPKGNNRKVSVLLNYILGSVLILALGLFIIIIGGKKEEIDKDKGIMGLEKLIEMQNGNILTQEVEYETSKKIDPKDTSGIFFEVVNGNDKFQEGDLVKFNHRFRELQQIEGKEYCVIDPSQIQFKIKKEDVKADILKR